MIAPLAGARVVDFTHGFAGPMCGYHLGLFGAEVIKVERPGTGDPFRQRGRVFDAANAGKRSLVLDTTQPDAPERVARLVADADIVLHNFRPSVATRIGLTPQQVRETNPAAILCTITGYGLRGPWQDRPAIEWTAQAASGLMASYVDLDDHDQHGALILDPFTGMLAVQSVLAAWITRLSTGEGTHVDVSLLDTALLAQTGGIPDAARGGSQPPRRRRPGVGRFQAKDDVLYIGAVTPIWHERTFAVLGLGADRLAEIRAGDDLTGQMRAAFEEALADRVAAEVSAELNAVGVPAAVAERLPAVLAPEHPLAPHLSLETTTDSTGAEVTVVGSAVRFDGVSLGPAGPAPMLGEYDDQVWS